MMSRLFLLCHLALNSLSSGNDSCPTTPDLDAAALKVDSEESSLSLLQRRGTQLSEIVEGEMGMVHRKDGLVDESGKTQANHSDIDEEQHIHHRHHHHHHRHGHHQVPSLRFHALRAPDATLKEASEAPLHTFYMYRAQDDERYPPTNTNLASLTGVLWYLHNEIAPYCTTHKEGGAFGHRRFRKTRIVRYKVTTKATNPLWRRGMNFGVRVAFDSGKNTGAWETWRDKQPAYEKYGYVVGCNVLGAGPFPICPSAQGAKEKFCPIAMDKAYWYSLPGACPTKNYWAKSDSCKKSQPGGYCKGTPTGRGDCTWSYEYAGDVRLDDLVGITGRFKNYHHFCRKGCREYINYGPHSDRGSCGITFWNHRHSRSSNRWRARRLDRMFKRKYPSMPSDSELPPPHCDFNRRAFYKGL
eukprot:TRINITY_DN21338_c0_g3_i1.p1 TRINITY_DN21338_c0_g3~~TRINITY_DN21338_c0_g3_i1.p1  ORF type:complete len:413 (+),score=50.69 TRINITY_DN21338_c0_g3_i1:31-1269(+)